MTTKYTIIYNKGMDGDVYPVAIVNVGADLIDLYLDYNTQTRDKYDPFTFIDWLVNVYAVRSWPTSSKTYTNNYDKANKFNFHSPVLPRRNKLKKVKVAKRIKTTKR